MASERGRTLTPHDVAEIWFGTRKPSADQLRKVYAKMQAGVLPLNDPQAPPARWTTNEQALAKYLAARRASKEAAQHEKGKRVGPLGVVPPTPATFVHRGDKDLRDAYMNVWQDYFQAVMFRRRIPYASRAFTRAVAAGQLSAVLLIGILLAGALGAWTPGRTVEERLVGEHLAGTHGWYQVERWHPPATDDDGRRIVRVEYRYRDGDSHRVVHTDRTFVVTDAGASERSTDEGG